MRTRAPRSDRLSSSAIPALFAGLLLGLSGCCAAGEPTVVWDHVAELGGPLLVVYYPEHGTWNTRTTSTVLFVDDERVARLCEGDFVALPLETGTHVLRTSTDETSFGCRNTRDEAFPPLSVDVGNGVVVVRFGERPYPGPWSDASICERRLTEVDLVVARNEVDELGLVAEH